MRFRSLVPLTLLLLLSTAAQAQQNLLSAGPMPGFADMNEVNLWVQTKTPASVRIEYWPKGQPAQVHRTATARTEAITAHTAHLKADEVAPGTRYEYRLLVNDIACTFPYPLEFQAPALWQYRGDPPAFTLALGSCAYFNDSLCSRPGEPYGGEYQIFNSIHKLRPDLMLWLGDNLYFTECDWTSRAGMLRRYTKSRAYPQLQPLLASTNHLAIWDDHDYGPNDSDRGNLLKEQAREAFQLFWANPSYGIPGQAGITTSAEWADVQFFLLDDRYFRSNNDRVTGERSMLGKAQLEWLFDALRMSKATFKFVAMGGQILNPTKKYETYSNLFPEERNFILETIVKERIPGVIFLSGDRHETELTMYQPEGFYPLYDLTISPLTSKPATAPDAENTLRVEGTFVGQRNFGLLKFEGPRTDRKLTISVYDSNGKELWIRTLNAKDLVPH